MKDFLFSNYIGKLALVDFLIVVAYLTLTLVVGLIFAKRVTSFRNYAIGAKDFTTPALTATVVATFIESMDLIGVVEAVHSTGFIWVWICMGVLISNFITIKFIAPRIYYYKDEISVGEIVGKTYGKNSGILTGISGFLDAVGSVTLEITALGIVCQTFFGIPPFTGVLIGATIITIYSFAGGIYSVTITDIVQLFFIIIAIPLILNLGLFDIGSYSGLIDAIPAEKFSFNLKELPLSKSLLLFVAYCIPFLRPTAIQRLLMCNSSKQAVSSISISSIMYTIFYLIAGGISLLCIYYYPEADSHTVFLKLFDDKLPTIAKGIIISGLIAAAMSSADSRLNSASVMIANDIVKPLKPNISDASLLKIAKFSTILVGILAIISSFFFNRLIDIVLTFYSFWLPIVTVPLFFAIIGFRASGRTFLTAAASGFSIFLIWKIFGLEEKLGIDHLFLCVLANTLVFFTLRHLEKDKLPEAFVKIKPYGDMEEYEPKKIKDIPTLQNSIKHTQRSLFGIFIIINYFLPFYMWAPEMNHTSSSLYIRLTAGLLCSLLIVAHKLPKIISSKIDVYWYFVLFFVLPFSTTYFFLENSGSTLAMINLALSILLLTSLTNWLSFIFILVIGSILSYQFFMFENPDLIIHLSAEQIYILIYIIIFSSLIGLLFNRNRELLNSKVKGILEYEVNERTKELYEEKQKIELLNVELQAALTVKKRFLSNFSHEIRAPLTNIFGATDVLYYDWNKLDEVAKIKFIEMAKNNQERLLALVSNLLDLSALDSGNMKFNFRYTQNIVKATKDAIDNFASRAEDKGQNVILETDYQALNTKCDYVRIIQVIGNLISNAISFSPKDTEIRVEVTRDENNIIVSVQDEGVGIDSSEIDKIFEAFTESTKTASLAGGRGMGLTIAKHIIEAHNGTIKGESMLEEKGSRFTISLPIIKENEAEVTEIIQEKASAKHVVLVDDDDNMRSSEIMSLESLGYKVTEFTDGIYALEYIKENADSIDVVITDVMMPIMKGDELIKALQADEATKHILIAVQSGECHDLHKYLEIGAKAIMEKPYNRTSIAELMRKVFE